MTASDVLLDTTAWWEILAATTAGKRLQKRFLASKAHRVHASALTLGEIMAKTTAAGAQARGAQAVQSIRAASDIHPVTEHVAVAGGVLRAELRRTDADASLVDAIILATARHLGATLVTNDSAFAGQADVILF